MICTAGARLFKSLGSETRLKILRPLMGREGLRVCDCMRTPNLTPLKGSRPRRDLYHPGGAPGLRAGPWMHCRVNVSPGPPGFNHRAKEGFP